MISKQRCIKPSNETVWVLGGGRFGLHTVKILKQEIPTANIIVVDCQPIGNLPYGVEFVCADGVEWLTEHFTPNANVTRIIPTLPLHLALEWLKKKLSLELVTVDPVEIPHEFLSCFPHPFRKSSNQIVVSHADFLCPPNCSEPEELCTYTQKQRPQSLYRLLEKADCGAFVSLVVRSRQFYRGVGGFYPEDLWNLLNRTKSLPETPLLIGTACKCHGIVDGLSIKYSKF